MRVGALHPSAMERSTESRARDDFADETTEARRACAAAADADGSPEEEHASLLQQDFEDYDSGGHLLGWGEAPLKFRSGASAGEIALGGGGRGTCLLGLASTSSYEPYKYDSLSPAAALPRRAGELEARLARCRRADGGGRLRAVCRRPPPFPPIHKNGTRLLGVPSTL